jgi:hypothetical protein
MILGVEETLFIIGDLPPRFQTTREATPPPLQEVHTRIWGGGGWRPGGGGDRSSAEVSEVPSQSADDCRV